MHNHSRTPVLVLAVACVCGILLCSTAAEASSQGSQPATQSAPLAQNEQDLQELAYGARLVMHRRLMSTKLNYVANIPNITTISQNFVQRYSNASLDEQRAALQLLLQNFADLVSMIPEMALRLQLDVTWAAPSLLQASRLYTSKDHPVAITFFPPPSFSSPSEVLLSDGLLQSERCDGRFTDPFGSIQAASSLPNVTMPLLLYFRTDVFTTLRLPVPETWQQLVDLAAYMSNVTWADVTSASARSSTRQYSICFNPTRACGRAAFILMAILASHTQAQGPQHGFLLDPTDLRPLVDTAAGASALRVYQQLLQQNHPGAQDTCLNGDLLFSAGECLMTINFEQFRDSPDVVAQVHGSIGAALLPGATEVLDRLSGQLVPCTADLCPLAVPATSPALQQSGVLVNRAGLVAGVGFMAQTSVSASVQDKVQILAFENWVATNIEGPWLEQLPLIPLSDDGASVTTAANATDANGTVTAAGTVDQQSATLVESGWDVGWFQTSGYSGDDLSSYALAYEAAAVHPNRALDLQIRGWVYFRLIFAEAAENVTTAADMDGILGITSTMGAKVAMVLSRVGDVQQWQQLYQSQVGWVPGSSPRVKDSAVMRTIGFTAGSGRKSLAAGLLIAVVVPLAVGAVLAALVVSVWALRRGAGRTLLGAMLPPGLGDGTTLIVTDIQNSTVLWEQFAPEVMDCALAVHHQTIRAALVEHRGYESATEGDSFIIAFHAPGDALQFCITTQKRLLEANWPRELLQGHEECQAVYAMPAGCLSRLHGLSSAITALVGSTANLRSTLHSHASTLSFVMDDPNMAASGVFTKVLTRTHRKWLNGAWLRGLAGHGSSSGSRAASVYVIPSGLQGDEGLQEGAPPSTVSEKILAKTEAPEPSAGGIPSSTVPALSKADATTSCTFGEALCEAWRPANPADKLAAFLVFRGLRVRMGCHSGLHDANCCVRDAVSGRMQYHGDFLTTAKHVSDAAHGGMLIISAATFSQLQLSDVCHEVAVVDMGEHLLCSDDPAGVRIYQAVPLVLAGRLPLFQQPRTAKALSQSVMAAPVGSIAVAFVNAVGVQALLAWSTEVARQALEIYQGIAKAAVVASDGYVVESSGGLVLASFPHAGLAIAGSLDCHKKLIAAPWPKELLAHELCEAISFMELDSNGDMQKRVWSRGLRIKAGIDVGGAVDFLHLATGQMGYRGRVMNRAARIANLASTSQVLCSRAAWEQAVTHEAVMSGGIVASEHGAHQLKGIAEKMEVLQCTAPAASCTTSMVLRLDSIHSRAFLPSPTITDTQQDWHHPRPPLSTCASLLGTRASSTSVVDSSYGDATAASDGRLAAEELGHGTPLPLRHASTQTEQHATSGTAGPAAAAGQQPPPGNESGPATAAVQQQRGPACGSSQHSSARPGAGAGREDGGSAALTLAPAALPLGHADQV